MRKAVDSSMVYPPRHIRSLATVVAVTSLLAVAAAPARPSDPPPLIAPASRVESGQLSPKTAVTPLTINVASDLPRAESPLELLPTTAARTRFPWRNLEGKFWQVVAQTTPEDPAVTDLREGTRGACGGGMVEVKGRMKDDAGDWFGVDGLQQLTCKKWISREWPERCGEYDRDAWLEKSKAMKTMPMHFCIDRFEYPNRLGANPIVLVDWNEANALCKRDNKRLCTEDEWTFACEGEEAQPYPQGYAREDVCVNDRQWREFKQFGRRDGEATMLELDRLWQGEPSGSKPRCKSPFGVYDMTGNIDEWTRSSRPNERPSVLKGGYWGPVRTRCRPATKAHGETHVFYQEGLRCCADGPSP